MTPLERPQGTIIAIQDLSGATWALARARGRVWDLIATTGRWYAVTLEMALLTWVQPATEADWLIADLGGGLPRCD